MTNKFRKIILVLILVVSVWIALAPVDSFAITKKTSDEIERQLGAAGGESGLGTPIDPRLLAANIIRVMLGLLGMIFFCLNLYAGFLWMTAGGEDEKVTKAKTLLTQAVVGLAIILSAYAITTFAIKLALGAYDAPLYESENLWFDMWVTPPSPNANVR